MHSIHKKIHLFGFPSKSQTVTMWQKIQSSAKIKRILLASKIQIRQMSLRKTYVEKKQKQEEKEDLLSSFSGFCLRSGLDCSHPAPLSLFNFSRCFSLCFLDFFFLCWLLWSCCWVQPESPCGVFSSFTLASCSFFSEICPSDRPWSKGKPPWATVRPQGSPGMPPIRWGSATEMRLGSKVTATLSCALLVFASPFAVDWCNLWSVSFCLFAASLSCESRGKERF